MAIVDGRDFAQEKLMDAAALILNAYYKAPLSTSRLRQKSVIVTGEDMLPMLEVIEILMEKMGGEEAVKELAFPLYADYITYRDAIDQGRAPVTLLLGADLTKADLGWDCGACGFSSCGELIKHYGDYGGPGRLAMGPSCAWKSFDFGIACDYACAAAWELNIENRIEGSMGLLGLHLGYMDDVTSVLALPLGPITELWYYNRPTYQKIVTAEDQSDLLRRCIPEHYMMFSGDKMPPIKQEGAWWDQPEEFVRVGPVPEYSDTLLESQGALLEAIFEVRPKVEKIRQAMKEKKAALPK